MKKLILLLAVALGATSCNTMIGMSRDIRMLGQGIEHKANGRNFSGDEPGQTNQDNGNLPTY